MALRLILYSINSLQMQNCSVLARFACSAMQLWTFCDHNLLYGFLLLGILDTSAFFPNYLGKYSLSDALAEIKYLKRQISLRDENIAFLTLQVNQLTGKIPYDSCSGHNMTSVDGIITQGIDNMGNFTPIAFERYHAHAHKCNSFANVLPYEPTVVQVNSNNVVPQVSFDRYSVTVIQYIYYQFL